MLKLSTFPIKTLKTRPVISDNISTSILLQAGFIRQAMAGAYEFLPLGYRILKNIENIVREEMDKIGYSEMLMTILTPKSLWDKTGRWDVEEYFKVPGAGNSEYRIAPTNEENVTPIMAEFIQSYKDLPAKVYHIQKKFRNEKRAKSGLLRGREFSMKDAYSFHANMTDFKKTYEDIKTAYIAIFSRLGLGKDTYIADADGGAISDLNSHEFQVKLGIGEDLIYKCNSCSACLNDELVDENNGYKCIECGTTEFETFKASEVGNIFHLGEKYSKPFGVKYLDENNKMVERVEMGCYGIGTSRLLGVMAEYFMTEKGIAWPESVAPASYYIIVLGEENLEKAEKLAKKLEAEGKEVILDDRMDKKMGFGKKAGDCELFGIPNRIVISPKTIGLGGYELTLKGEESNIINF